LVSRRSLCDFDGIPLNRLLLLFAGAACAGLPVLNLQLESSLCPKDLLPLWFILMPLAWTSARPRSSAPCRPTAPELPVRRFASFTPDLHALVRWCQQCRIRTVAMESTSVYWIPLYDLLVAAGIEVYLVNARHVKNVPGRKSDAADCQWLQQLHSYGLLRASFRPGPELCALRVLIRQRDTHLRGAARQVQHMQKALKQMNLQLSEVLTDITGVTGLSIIEAIVAGERDPARAGALPRSSCQSFRSHDP
jgi:transposase